MSANILHNFAFTRDMFSVKFTYGELSTQKGDFKDWFQTLSEEDFEPTKIAYQNTETLNLEERSSLTCKKELDIYLHDLEKIITFKLIKYNVGDFFKLHKDSQGTHTILIFCPSDFKGGALKLKKNDLCELVIRPEVMKKFESECYTMVTFSTDFLHEVEPITEGVRYVLKGSYDDEEGEEVLENEGWSGGLDAACGDY